MAERKNCIVVHHVTMKDFDANRPGIGQVFHYDNPEAMQGFWVSTDLSEAGYFITDQGRILTYEMDITNALFDEKDVDAEEISVDEIYDREITTILGAEGDDNHVVHDTRILRLLDEQDANCAVPYTPQASETYGEHARHTNCTNNELLSP